MPRKADYPHRQPGRDDFLRPAAICAWRAAPPTPEGQRACSAGTPAPAAVPGCPPLPGRRTPRTADYPRHQPGRDDFLRPAAICAWGFPRIAGEGPMIRREQRAPSAGSSCRRGAGASRACPGQPPSWPQGILHMHNTRHNLRRTKAQHVLTGACPLSRRTPGRMRRCPRTRQCPQDPSWHLAGIRHSRCRPLLRLRRRLHAEHGQRAVPRSQEPPQEGDVHAPLSPDTAMPAGSVMASRGHWAQPMPPRATPAAPSPRRTWSACCPAQTGTAAGRRCSPADRRRRGAAPRGAAPAAPRRGRPPAPASGSPG